MSKVGIIFGSSFEAPNCPDKITPSNQPGRLGQDGGAMTHRRPSFHQITPKARMASATRTKPVMLAPST